LHCSQLGTEPRHFLHHQHHGNIVPEKGGGTGHIIECRVSQEFRWDLGWTSSPANPSQIVSGLTRGPLGPPTKMNRTPMVLFVQDKYGHPRSDLPGRLSLGLTLRSGLCTEPRIRILVGKESSGCCHRSCNALSRS
jgi:hypothetical protein